jgi:hypothetical protein
LGITEETRGEKVLDLENGEQRTGKEFKKGFEEATKG